MCDASTFPPSPSCHPQNVLVGRLLAPPLPVVLRGRKIRGEYVPRLDSGNCAILVALHLYETDWLQANSGGGNGVGGGSEGVAPLLTKDDLIFRAEATGISAEHMNGSGGMAREGSTTTAIRGVFKYDGWSNIKVLEHCEPHPLVRRKANKFQLTTLPADGNSGRQVARALHEQCHAEARCRCGRVDGLVAAGPTVGLRGLAHDHFLDIGAESRGGSRTEAESASSLSFSPSLSSSPSSASSSSFSSSSRPLMASGYVPPAQRVTQQQAAATGYGHSSGSSGSRGSSRGGSGTGSEGGPAGSTGATRATKVVTCGNCGAQGHNSRNALCPHRLPSLSSSSPASTLQALSSLVVPSAQATSVFAPTSSPAVARRPISPSMPSPVISPLRLTSTLTEGSSPASSSPVLSISPEGNSPRQHPTFRSDSTVPSEFVILDSSDEE